MKFKAKLRKIGNSIGVLIPREVITEYVLGDEIEFQVITSGELMPEKKRDVITKTFNPIWCNKHDTYKGTCGCK